MRLSLLLALAALGASSGAQARAGVLTDDFTRCLVTKSTDSDRAAFMGWMFSAISAEPRLNKLTTLDRAGRDRLNSSAADVMQRLILIDCRKEAVAALKADGADAFGQSFAELGRSAAEQMFRSPAAQVELEALGKSFDDEKLKALGREAGIPESQLKKQ
jgi:hypothetical protein